MISRLPSRPNTTGATLSDQPTGDLLIPIFNNYADTHAILSVLARDHSFDGKIVLVHDASTDEKMAPLLRAYASGNPRVLLIENPSNVGFVGSCNRGFEACRGDVLILNTDITLPPGAPGRILRRLRYSKRTATVTPMSNSAYGVGFPDLVYPNALPFGATSTQIDDVLQSMASFAPIELATGVGFCMAISRDALDVLGGFDEAFSPGYGEESDFCQRAASLGFKNLLAPDVFVEHKGGMSFGGSWQDKSRRGLLKVLNRHPRYVGRVRTYLNAGEARSLSFAALVSLAERLSGQQVEVCEEGGEHGLFDPRKPRATVIALGLGCRAALHYAGEGYTFDFARREDLTAALALRNRQV